MSAAWRCLLVSIAVIACASSARADGNDDAEHLFDEGKALMNAGDYPAACAKFAASLRLDSGIGTMLWLADCFEHNGQTASAWEQYREAAAAAAKAGDEREKVATARAAGIEPRLSKLKIVVAHPVDGLAVERDGIAVARSLWGAELPVDPGKHTIVAKAPNHAKWQTLVDVGPNGAIAAASVPDFGPEPAPRATPRPAPVEADRNLGRTQRIAGLAVGGAGVVALGVSAYFGLHAKSLNDSATPNCPAAGCNDRGFTDRSDAKSAARWSTGFFAGGALAVAAGATLFFTAPTSHSEVTASPMLAPHAAGLHLGATF